MDEIITERSGNILRVELNRPTKRNAMTSRMYEALADIFHEAFKQVVHLQFKVNVIGIFDGLF